MTAYVKQLILVHKLENDIVERKLQGGEIMLRLRNTPKGAWLSYRCAFDAILAYVQSELGLGFGSRLLVAAWLEIEQASISRHRADKLRFQDKWLLRFHDLSGIPLDELRYVGGLAPTQPRHEKARPVPVVYERSDQ